VLQPPVVEISMPVPGDEHDDSEPDTAWEAILDDPQLSEFAALVTSSAFELSLQDPANTYFLIFAPVNGELIASADIVVSYINIDRAGSTILAEVPEPGSYRGTGASGVEFLLAGEGETLTVNGSPAVVLFIGAGGTVIKFGG